MLPSFDVYHTYLYLIILFSGISELWLRPCSMNRTQLIFHRKQISNTTAYIPKNTATSFYKSRAFSSTGYQTRFQKSGNAWLPKLLEQHKKQNNSKKLNINFSDLIKFRSNKPRQRASSLDNKSERTEKQPKAANSQAEISTVNKMNQKYKELYFEQSLILPVKAHKEDKYPFFKKRKFRRPKIEPSIKNYCPWDNESHEKIDDEEAQFCLFDIDRITRKQVKNNRGQANQFFNMKR